MKLDIIFMEKDDNDFDVVREGVNGKKRFLSGIARMMGGGSTHARIFWPSF